MDSELKNIYQIDEKLTWIEQKEEIITKLLPPLYKLVNKKYNVTNNKLLMMLYKRWRSRHRVHNIRMKGEDKMKQEKRRVRKNTRMQDVSKCLIINGNVLIILYFTISSLEKNQESPCNTLPTTRQK